MRVRIAILTTLVLTIVVRAERPGQDQKEATNVVVGTIEKIKTSDAKFGADGALTTYTAEIKVEKVERGEGVKTGDTVTVTWFHVTKRPSKPFPGAYGHEYKVKEKDPVRVYLIKDGKGYNVIYNASGVEKVA